MSLSYTFVIPGEPMVQKRARARIVWVGGKPRPGVYDDPEISNKTGWKGQTKSFLVAELEREGIPIPLYPEGPVRLYLSFLFSCPKSDYRKRTPRPMRWHTKRPDIDNCKKAILDAASGVLWADDKQVCCGWSDKRITAQGKTPRTILTVSLAPDNPAMNPEFSRVLLGHDE